MSRTRCARFPLVPILVVCCALVVQVDARAQCQVDKVNKPGANDTTADRYGWSVAVNGDYAVVGADKGDGGGGHTPQADTGAAFLLKRDGLNWVEMQQLVATDPLATAGNEFGSSVAISPNADFIVVGAKAATGRASAIKAGAVYVFKRFEDSFPCDRDSDCENIGLTTCTNSTCGGLIWAVEDILLADVAKLADGFGFSVDISGDVVVVGADRVDGTSANDIGAAYVFRRYQDNFPCASNTECQDKGFGDCVSAQGVCEGVAWVLEQKLTGSIANAVDFFGNSVSIEGNRIAVGARSLSGNGAAYIFEYDGSTWAEAQKVTASDGQGADAFGQAVDLDGDALVVTALNADPGGVQNAGKAYVYRRIGGAFGDENILTASNGLTRDRFGRSASLHGDNLLIGSRDTDLPDHSSGTAYLFNFDGTNWDEIEAMQASDAEAGDRFGHAVSLGETYGIIGAYREDDAGLDAGAAYIFAIGLGRDCNLNAIPDDCEVIDGSAPDENNDGNPDECECANDAKCPAGDECTTAICNLENLCDLSIDPGFCRINGMCYAEGEIDPNLLCSECNPAVSNTVWSAIPDGLPCLDDGLFCNGPETCVAGICGSHNDPCSDAALPICDEDLDECIACVTDQDCEDNNRCTSDSCESTICLHVALTAGIPCGDPQANACDRPDTCNAVGQCQANPQPDGTDCNDQLFCNGTDSCLSGLCQSSGDPCGGELPPACDEEIDACVECVADASCDDGLFCTGVESCTQNLCSSPGDPCAGTDSPICVEENDVCVACTSDHDCHGGTECLRALCHNGQCGLSQIFPFPACGDRRSTPCDGPDFCDPTGACFDNVSRNGDSCEDTLFCTGEDTCQEGVCLHTGNDCTDAGLFCDEEDDSCTDTRPTKVIYSNTFGDTIWRPYPTGIRIADDIVTTAIDACRINEVTIRVNGGIPEGGGIFAVITRLWDGCPSRLGSSIITGTDILHEGLDDNASIDHDLQLLPPGEAIELPPSFWIQVSCSTPESGWVAGTPATTGFSGNWYDHPFTGCRTFAGQLPSLDPSVHPSGYVIVRAEEPCATMFPTYRAISPNAEPFVPPLGSENRVADDLELIGGSCELAGYEIAIQGTAGHYEMSVDLRLTPDGAPIPGTELVFKGRGENNFEVARLTVPPDTVIELLPDVWMTWQANKPDTGVLNVGRTQIGRSEPTFAMEEPDHWIGTRWDFDQTLPAKEAAFHISVFCRGTERAGTCCPAHAPGMEPTCDEAVPVTPTECAFTDPRCGILFDCPAGRWVERGQCFVGGGQGGSFRPVCGVHACCGFETCTNRSYESCMSLIDPNAIDRPCETHLDCPGDRFCQANGICEPEHAQWFPGEFCDEQSFTCPDLACEFSEGDCFSRTDELPCVTNADCPSFRRCLTELDVPVCEARAGCGSAACCNAVCGSGPVGEFCCEFAWDSICAAFADIVCGQSRGDTCFDETDPNRSAIDLGSGNVAVIVDNRNANVIENEPGFACHSVTPGKKGRGSTWLRFQATDTSARVHTCDTPGTAGPSDSLLQVMGVEDAKLGVCNDATACNVVLQDCADGSTCQWDGQRACESLSTIGCNDDTDGCGENGLNSDLCVTGLVPNDWYYVLVASKTDAFLGPHRVTIESPCPALPPLVPCERIVSSVPDNCAIDARQPHAIDNNEPQSLNRLTLTFAPENCDPRALSENGFQVESMPAETLRRAFLMDTDQNHATIQLDRPLSPKHWTCISHIGTEGRTCIGSLPGDVDGDGASNPALDLSALFDCLNSPGTCSPWQEDIDRDGAAAGVLDLIRLIDLFNGAGVFESWTGASMFAQECPSR